LQLEDTVLIDKRERTKMNYMHFYKDATWRKASFIAEAFLRHQNQ